MGSYNTFSLRILIQVQRYSSSRFGVSTSRSFGRVTNQPLMCNSLRCLSGHHNSTWLSFFNIDEFNTARIPHLATFSRRSSTTSRPSFTSQESESVTSSAIDNKNDDNRPGSLLPDPDGVTVIYFRGLPQITVPLPSRREKCRFILKPLTNTVGDLLHMIQAEDKGIDRAIALSQDGTRIAASNTIEMLMEQDFNLVINETVYRVVTPPQEKPSEEELERLSSVRNMVGQLYAALNVDEHQLRREREMLTELESLRIELGPLEAKKDELSSISLKRTNTLTWVGLGLMSVQFGILARLTWWEYSWDIMEPVTYFVTYGTAMLAYAYFVVTKQDYVLPDVRDRQYLITFHKQAKKIGLDVDKYNTLRSKISKIENDLHRLRDPLALHLPLKTRPGVPHSHSYSTDSSQCIIGKAHQKFQEILQKAQKTSQST